MTMRRIAPFFAALSLAACGSHTVSFSGHVVDSSGVAVSNAAVTIRNNGFSEDPLVDPDYLERAEIATSTTTDGDGRFSVGQTFRSGGFGCGDGGGTLTLVVAPNGIAGPVAMRNTTDQGSDAAIAMGDLHLPSGPTVAVADEQGLHATLDPAMAGTPLLHVDGQEWLLGADGALPAGALLACPGGGSCDHQITSVWVDGENLVRAATSTVTVAAPGPIKDVASNSVALDALTAVGDIYIDNVFSVDEARGGHAVLNANLVQVSHVLENPVRADHAVPLPVGACSIYGTGVRCTAPTAPIAGILAVANPDQELRLYAR